MDNFYASRMDEHFLSEPFSPRSYCCHAILLRTRYRETTASKRRAEAYRSLIDDYLDVAGRYDKTSNNHFVLLEERKIFLFQAFLPKLYNVHAISLRWRRTYPV